jgi:putative oxidoreductase
MQKQSLSETLSTWMPTMLSVLRIVAGLLFFEHGTMKILGFPVGPENQTLVAPGSMFWFAGLLELIGGPLLLVGLFTRPVAFLLSGQMAFAYFLTHARHSPFPAANEGDAAILYCFLFLFFVFSGPGPLSVDSRQRRRP